jgi:hypothetical protein
MSARPSFGHDGSVARYSSAQLHLAAALAHTVPGVALRLDRASRPPLHVAHQSFVDGSSAALSPCELRVLLAPDRRPAVVEQLELVGVEIVAGLVHLGGGVYARGHGPLGGERWFASTLCEARIVELFARDPFEISEHALDVRVVPDDLLGITVVCITATRPRWFGLLDEIAHWAVSECLVGELAHMLETSAA